LPLTALSGNLPFYYLGSSPERLFAQLTVEVRFLERFVLLLGDCHLVLRPNSVISRHVYPKDTCALDLFVGHHRFLRICLGLLLLAVRPCHLSIPTSLLRDSGSLLALYSDPALFAVRVVQAAAFKSGSGLRQIEIGVQALAAPRVQGGLGWVWAKLLLVFVGAPAPSKFSIHDEAPCYTLRGFVCDSTGRRINCWVFVAVCRSWRDALGEPVG
jgi:hypothetical protein